MEFLKVLLVIVEAIVSFLLIGLILLQKARNEGLGLAFGANVGESLFGSRAGNVLTRGTVTLGSIFAINTVILAMMFTGGGEKTLMEKAVGAAAANQAAATQGAPKPSAQPAPAPGVPPATPAAVPAGPATMPNITVPVPVTPAAPAATPAAAAPAPAPAAKPAAETPKPAAPAVPAPADKPAPPPAAAK